jgi:cell fate (sporulation/competence/biofilm development) regulator YmcA (YheA/YmcA/DUF963 family)
MAASDWATVIYSYVFVTGGVGTVLWFILKKAIHHVIAESQEDLRTIKAEITPNHGSSLNDVIKLQVLPLIKELRENQVEVQQVVSKLEGKFEQHIEEHSLNRG